MGLERIEFTKLKLNKDNPRCLKKDKRTQLINSLLLFPSMLNVRPQVVTKELIIIGGNARQKAIEHIYSLGWDSVKSKIIELYGNLLQRGQEYEQSRIDYTLEFWTTFFNDKKLPVFIVDEFTQSEYKEFVIKDNLCVGEWDMDLLSTICDMETLFDYGFAPWELGIEINTDMDLIPNNIADAINKDFFQITFTFPVEHKAKFDSIDKKVLQNLLMEFANGNDSSK